MYLSMAMLVAALAATFTLGILIGIRMGKDRALAEIIHLEKQKDMQMMWMSLLKNAQPKGESHERTATE